MVDADMEALGLEAPGEGKAALERHKLNIVDKALVNPTGGMER
ncbi:MAG: hypothetical protein DDT40_01556 [candidate division WS2 bacterium]|nr:hypothetical protein [Candidatus Psychracetigena formicireducens]